MNHHPTGNRRRTAPLVSIALWAAALSSCQATAPRAWVNAESVTIRGETLSEAQEVAGILMRLRPELEATLPGIALGELDIWVQDQPHVWSFPSDHDQDAEGLYAPGLDRILLSRATTDKTRVLAHELTHAALQAPWDRLPGTLEEGLCDCVASHLAPAEAARLRAGRLSGAALACGGVHLGLRALPIHHGPQAQPDFSELWESQILLSSTDEEPDAIRRVFQVAAGLSTTRLSTESKRSFYGLSFLVVERIVDRHGFEGLFRLCQKAESQGLETLPQSWLMEAAQLKDSPSHWRRAAMGAFGQAELEELICMYPGSIAGALTGYLLNSGFNSTHHRWWDELDVECYLLEGTAKIRLNDLWPIRIAVTQRLQLAASQSQP